jgi:hypothetical protein
MQPHRTRYGEPLGSMLSLKNCSTRPGGSLQPAKGQRFDSLDAIARAVPIRSDARLRNEALAALAHPDLRQARSGAPYRRTKRSAKR